MSDFVRLQCPIFFFVNVLSNQINHLFVINVELLQGTIFGINVQKSDFFGIFINKVNESEAVFSGQFVFFVGQTSGGMFA